MTDFGPVEAERLEDIWVRAVQDCQAAALARIETRTGNRAELQTLDHALAKAHKARIAAARANDSYGK
jgi:hypothetical protein